MMNENRIAKGGRTLQGPKEQCTGIWNPASLLSFKARHLNLFCMALLTKVNCKGKQRGHKQSLKVPER